MYQETWHRWEEQFNVPLISDLPEERTHGGSRHGDDIDGRKGRHGDLEVGEEGLDIFKGWTRKQAKKAE